jgi:hypothetical protein
MPKFVIEREIPRLGDFTDEQITTVAQRSCDVLRSLGPEIQWVQSFVTTDKMYCIYIAPSEEMILEHARRGGFPANRIARITRIIDPTTAEETTSETPMTTDAARAVPAAATT